MYIYVNNLTIIGSGNGLSPGRHQAIIWTNAKTLGTNFSEIFFKVIYVMWGKIIIPMYTVLSLI